MTIWKFLIDTTDMQEIEMPEGAEILTVQLQHGKPCLWAIVNPEAACRQNRRIETFGTGHLMSEQARRYVGSYQLYGGDLVFHVFEAIN